MIIKILFFLIGIICICFAILFYFIVNADIPYDEVADWQRKEIE
jgi:hypothetical protein